MESNRFDRLARVFASAPSRRAVVRGLAGAAFGAGLLGTAAPAGAACTEVGDNKNCNKDNDCCDNARCRNKRCECTSGYRNCNGKCRDLNSDKNNCGRCGRNCNNNETCVKEQGKQARCRKSNNVCADIGQRCGNGVDCCGGLACAAGNDAFRACVLA